MLMLILLGNLFCVLFFQPKPRIDYTLKAVGGSLTAIPGLSDMIDVSFCHIRVFTSMVVCFSVDSFCFSLSNGQDTVNSIVTDMLQWPHRMVIPIGGIPVDIRYLTLF